MTSLSLGCASSRAPREQTPASLRAQYWAIYGGLQVGGRPAEAAGYGYGRALFQQAMPRRDGARVAWFFRAMGDRSARPPRVELAAGPCEGAPGVECRYVPLPFPSAQGSRAGLVEVRAREGAPAGYGPGDDWRVKLFAPGEAAPTEVALRRPPGPGEGAFSFVAYSCNRPYHRGEDGDRVRAANVNSLNLFRALVESERGRPAFSLGLGDQIYVDPDPEDERGLSPFAGKYSDRMRFAVKDSDALLEETYRAHFALPPFDRALRAVPSAMMWDDHEMRDGASPLDECDAAGRCAGPMAEYFARARLAFEAFEASRNPPANPARSDRDLDAEFSWGPSVDVFLLDLRSSRSAKHDSVMAAAQFERLRGLLGRAAAEKAGREHLVVIASATPLAEGLLRGDRPVKPGEKDGDALGDSWGSVHFDATRRRTFELLQAHFEANPSHRLLVLSGDIHESGLVWLGLEGPQGYRVFGHEIVSSGVANTRESGASNMRLGEIGAELGKLGKIAAWAGGVVKSAPAFAQIFVEPGPPLRVSFAMHVSGAPADAPALNPLAKPYHLAELADFAPDLERVLAGPAFSPRWAAYRREGREGEGRGAPAGAGLTRVPLPVGALPLPGQCPKINEAADWPADPCGALPFDLPTAGGDEKKGPGRADLHGLSVWGVVRRGGKAVKQAEFATDWLDVFAGERPTLVPR
ncbi:MAG TPA: alkaline phosphatase D family protein [Polyangiaceae bacterium]|nr:alkaline phosphatase D family protein [Polyangiaceae bacterium]